MTRHISVAAVMAATSRARRPVLPKVRPGPVPSLTHSSSWSHVRRRDLRLGIRCSRHTPASSWGSRRPACAWSCPSAGSRSARRADNRRTRVHGHTVSAVPARPFHAAGSGRRRIRVQPWGLSCTRRLRTGGQSTRGRHPPRFRADASCRRPADRGENWWSWGDSNPLPFDCQSNALPIELQPHGRPVAGTSVILARPCPWRYASTLVDFYRFTRRSRPVLQCRYLNISLNAGFAMTASSSFPTREGNNSNSTTSRRMHPSATGNTWC